jgi:hypothetical protein
MTCTAVERPSSYKLYAYLSSTWTDITSDAVTDNIAANWGMKGYGENDRLAGTGQMTFTLNNTASKYIPGVTGAVTGWTIGVPIKIVLTYDSVDYIRFRGFVSKLDPVAGAHANEARVKVTVLDWMDYAARYPLVSPAIQLNKTADVALTTILASMPIPPQATDFDTGTQTFQALFDTVTTGTKAYTEFNKLALSELGYIFLKKDATYGETLRFESATYRNGSRTVKQVAVPSCDSGFLLNEDGSYLLNEDGSRFLLDMGATDVIISNTMLNMSIVYGKNIINRATARAHPKKTDTSPVVLYSLDTPMEIAAGSTITFKGNYSDPIGGLTANAISNQMIDPVVDIGISSLLHFNGPSQSTVFVDESGKTWTRFGDAHIDAVNYKFGNGAGAFDGTGDYISTPRHVDFEPGAGDFTLDFWVRFASANADVTLYARNSFVTNTNHFALNYHYPANTMRFYSKVGGTVKADYLFPFTPTLNTWYHIAVVRSSTNLYMFLNGVSQTLTVGTAIGSNDLTLATPETYTIIGQDSSGNRYLNGWIDEFRWMKGTAAWTSDFTIPSVEYGSDYALWENSDETGANLTSYLNVSVVYGTEAPFYTVTNTYGSIGWITKLQARGYGIYAYNPIEGTVEDSTSILAYGENAETVDQLYQRDLTSGSAWATAIVAAEKDPRLVLESVTMNANTSGTLMQSFLNCDVGDMVHVEETRTGINGNFYIQNVSYEIQPGGIINFTWGLKEQL